MRPRFDDRDARIVAERCAKWDRIDGPRVGDFCQLKDGALRRIATDNGDVVVTASDYNRNGFYLGDGYMVYGPGEFYSAIPKRSLQRLPFARKGMCWITHHNAPRAVFTEVNCRVYMEV